MRALLDLLMPAVCAGCGEPGAAVCVRCLALLAAAPAIRWPRPAPPGLPPPFAVADYAGAVRRIVLAYKDRDGPHLALPLASALAASVGAAVGSALTPVLVVPVPSTAAARRRRGYDPVGRLAGHAVRLLTAAGRPVAVSPLLVHARKVRDSAGLGAVARADNLHGALRMRSSPADGDPAVVLVDDVMTTGVTLAEAARALRAGGVDVAAAAVVAATVRRDQWSGGVCTSGQAAHYGAPMRPGNRREVAWTSS